MENYDSLHHPSTDADLIDQADFHQNNILSDQQNKH
jgi:hypothetical protein